MSDQVYFIITNMTETNYVTGLNEVDVGFCITTKNHINDHYKNGIYIRQATLPFDDSSFKITADWFGKKWHVNKIILGKPYCLANPRTYQKLGIPYLSECQRQERQIPIDVDYASANGFVEVLEYWKKSGAVGAYSVEAIDLAAANGHVRSLVWWRYSGLSVKCTSDAMDYASANGHDHVLNWCKLNGLEKINNKIYPLKYTSMAIYLARKHGHDHIVKWWQNSGLDVKYSADTPCYTAIAIYYAKQNSSNFILDWKKYYGPKIKYPVHHTPKKSSDSLCYFQITSDLIDSIEWVDPVERGFSFKFSNGESKTTYFTTAKYVHQYYDDGNCIQEIFLLENEPEFQLISLPDENIYSANKMVLGKKYPLNNPSTYLTLHIPMMSMDMASKYGYIKILDHWIDNKLQLDYSEDAVDQASMARRIDVLNWWEKIADTYGIEFKYSNKAIEHAINNDDIVIITWWNNSKYKRS